MLLKNSSLLFKMSMPKSEKYNNLSLSNDELFEIL